MELAEPIIEEAKALANQYLLGDLQLPTELYGGQMWLALPDDNSVLAFGAITVRKGEMSHIFKIGVLPA